VTNAYTSYNHPVYVALQSIGRAIQDLRRPLGKITVVDPPYGSVDRHQYATDTLAGVQEVTEDLIGAAFVLAHKYSTRVNNQNPSTMIINVHHVANYWKHRDTWDQNWSNTDRQEAKTIAAVKALGATPPVMPGQLTKLAEVVLNQLFDVEVLWATINP
jgi:hypothetical protein